MKRSIVYLALLLATGAQAQQVPQVPQDSVQYDTITVNERSARILVALDEEVSQIQRASGTRLTPG